MNKRATTSIIMLTLLLAMGCGRQKKSAPSKAVEDFTGMTTIKQGEKMKKQIEEIRKAEEQRAKEAEDIK